MALVSKVATCKLKEVCVVWFCVGLNDKCITHRALGLISYEGIIAHDIVMLHEWNKVQKLMFRDKLWYSLEKKKVSLVNLEWEVIVSMTRDANSSNFVVMELIRFLKIVEATHILVNTLNTYN